MRQVLPGLIDKRTAVLKAPHHSYPKLINSRTARQPPPDNWQVSLPAGAVFNAEGMRPVEDEGDRV